MLYLLVPLSLFILQVLAFLRNSITHHIVSCMINSVLTMHNNNKYYFIPNFYSVFPETRLALLIQARFVRNHHYIFQILAPVHAKRSPHTVTSTIIKLLSIMYIKVLCPLLLSDAAAVNLRDRHLVVSVSP